MFDEERSLYSTFHNAHEPLRQRYSGSLPKRSRGIYSCFHPFVKLIVTKSFWSILFLSNSTKRLNERTKRERGTEKETETETERRKSLVTDELDRVVDGSHTHRLGSCYLDKTSGAKCFPYPKKGRSAFPVQFAQVFCPRLTK